MTEWTGASPEYLQRLRERGALDEADRLHDLLDEADRTGDYSALGESLTIDEVLARCDVIIRSKTAEEAT